MRSWLSQLSKQGEGPDITVFESEYDRTGVFSDFREFKESVLNNWEVPYVRYYTEGSLHGESNFVSSMSFMEFFN